MKIWRISWMIIVMVMRTKVALFFTFLFPLIFLFVYAGIFAHGNPHTVEYMFGQVLTLNILGAGFFGLGLQSVMQRERGTLRRYRLAPVSSLEIVTSNLLANYLIQVPVVAMLVIGAVGVFHMPLRLGLLPMIWFLTTVGIFAFAGYGLTLASVSNTMQEVQVYNNLAWFGLVFLSGITIPLPILPGWIQTVATFLPATYLVSAFQALMANSEPVSAHAAELIILVVSGFAGLFIAWKLFRWEKEERIPTSSKVWSLALLIPIIGMGFWMNIFANPRASWTKSYQMMNLMMAPVFDRGAVLVDFEKPDAAQNLAKAWILVPSAGSEGEVSLTAPGANGTQHALRFHGRLGTNGSDAPAVEAQTTLAIPPGSKAVHEIEFWIRGNDARAFQITLEESESGHQVTQEVRLEASKDWESVRIPVPPMAGAQVGTSSNAALKLTLKASAPAGEFSLDLDEIKAF